MDMFYVISSEKNANGTIKWAVSIPLEPADARLLAKRLVAATNRKVVMVRECEQFHPSPCGGCEHLMYGTCEGKPQTCENFKRLK